MTIATQTNKVLYSGSGLTVYPYTFKVFSASDIAVIRRAVAGTETTLTLTTDYTVSGVGSDAGGNVTLVGTQASSPPATGEKLLVKRLVPLTQDTDWQDNDNFPAAVLEDAVDRTVCIAQQLQEQIDRCFKVADTSTAAVIDPAQVAIDADRAAVSAGEASASAIAAAASASSLDTSSFMTKAILSNAGSIIYGSAAATPANLSAGADGEVLTLVSGLPSWEAAAGGTSKWTDLVGSTDFATTAVSTSTVTMVTDQTATIKVGMALKFTLSGTTYYAICTAITSSLLTIAGPPLTTTASALTALSYGLIPPYVERIQIPGYWAATADTAMLVNQIGVPYVWRGSKSYLVQIGAYTRTTDSGTNKPRLNARIGSTTTDYVSTSNSNAGIETTASSTWYRTVVDISSAKYSVNYGDVVELKTAAEGGNDDASDLDVELVFVQE